jgi:hypothetical protein
MVEGRIARRNLKLNSSLAALLILLVCGVGYQHSRAFNIAGKRGVAVDMKPARARIEVLPGQAQKVIDRAGNPITSVAIYGSRELDVSRIDLSSLRVAEAPLMMKGDGSFKSRLRDLNHDEFPDLLVYALTKELKLENRAGVELEGRTFDGLSFAGGQAVRYEDSSRTTLGGIVADAQNSMLNSNSIARITPQTVSLYTNSTKIFIPAIGGPTGTTSASGGSPASPYPSTITVLGFPTTIGRIAVILNGFEHCFPDDVDILLVGPTGAQALIMADDGGGSAIGTNAQYSTGTVTPTNPATGPNTTQCALAGASQIQSSPVTFSITSDSTRPVIPDTGGIPTGAYQPGKGATSSDTDPFPSPAPTPSSNPRPANFSAFIGTDPNGTWSLYAIDDQSGDVGAIDSGWTLDLAGPTAAAAQLSGQITTSDGQPLAGTVLNLAGSQSARTITDSTGHYKFDNLSTDGFYTLTPQSAGYSFSPSELSFSLNASKTDAVFTASPNSNATANPLDTEMFFVRQQYVDFLGREPDQGGLSYWTSEIEKCGTDADCLHNRRIDVSAAFFAESEGQRGAAFIYRLYKAGLGRRLSYAEFSRDREQVIGGANLEQSRASFADSFVQREEFVDKYKQSPSADSFVDALLSNIRAESGVDLTSARSNLIEKYQSGSSQTESRSLVLREGAESGLFRQAEYNASFVLMEYF